jgi:hypothetical protein
MVTGPETMVFFPVMAATALAPLTGPGQPGWLSGTARIRVGGHPEGPETTSMGY